jgi:hypothetical protein
LTWKAAVLFIARKYRRKIPRMGDRLVLLGVDSDFPHCKGIKRDSGAKIGQNPYDIIDVKPRNWVGELVRGSPTGGKGLSGRAVAFFFVPIARDIPQGKGRG